MRFTWFKRRRATKLTNLDDVPCIDHDEVTRLLRIAMRQREDVARISEQLHRRVTNDTFIEDLTQVLKGSASK